MAGGGAIANAFVELGDKLHQNTNQSIGTIGNVVNQQKALAENKRQFDKQFGLDQFLSMIQARDAIGRQEWQRGLRNALMGR